ncbi:pyrroloquinoline quinone biosynthesis peptide chaperone PqqD [Chthonobacter rhizosphaerae]|uniref:pyrroloquinoline quinone biosynthesis peptide chaperone PqqD n=1 Tax=Chthonobacter rhizosphaerae TaxID=2735553 RepID=UPI0015EEF703|nr:pyrroloquinoline quinone biosynthesis peptide chaperone PqqD [Chthonobacter rhizosphaerae]
MTATPEDRLPDTATPRISRGVRLRFDEARETYMLLAPERAVKVDPIAAAILEEVDGTKTFAAIVDTLAAKYAAPREQIAGDARRMLVDLLDKRMLEIAP